MINVLLAGDNNVFRGMALNILSCIKYTKSPVHYYLMTGEVSWNSSKKLSVENFKRLEKALKDANPLNEATYIDASQDLENCFKGSPNENPTYKPASLLRLFLTKYIDCDRLIYMDCDTMICNDLDRFEAIDMTGYEMGIVLDYMGRFWVKKDYFNSGVLYLNLPLVKENKVFEKALALLSKKKFYFADQTALYKSSTKRLYLPFDFNEQRSIKPETVIKHFNKGIQYFPYFVVYNVKQWNVKKVHRFLKIHQFDDVYEKYDVLFSDIAKLDYE